MILLFLGSSGVGKNTVMSAVCYFYTMDKEKTRPIKKNLVFMIGIYRVAILI